MYIYGKNVIREKLDTNDKINKAYISNNFKEQDIINKLREKKVSIHFVDNRVLNSKVEGLHQGIILEIDDIKTYTLEELLSKINNKNNVRLVMLDHLEDPHNFGAIIRTCEALGIMGIIIPNDRSVSINSTVVKTSVGAIEHISIIKVPNLQVAIKKLKENNYWIIGTDMKGTDYRKIDYNMNTCLVIGNEGKGISNVVKNNCDYIVTIPMKGKIDSLNASVSCGIILSRMVD
ncbi:MAG: 23S rRNA (guanosine(2251)-2'-O)-methyltransferase RlmB [Bacilli bacterium]|nr:23S rRNA (guanosine(2251)-2'-O)-methyltransferase RlmB [Bacilli bacterium]